MFSELGSSFYCVREHWWGAASLARNLIRTRLKICAMRPSRARAQCGKGSRSRKLHTTTGEPRLNVETIKQAPITRQNVPSIIHTHTHTQIPNYAHIHTDTQTRACMYAHPICFGSSMSSFCNRSHDLLVSLETLSHSTFPGLSSNCDLSSPLHCIPSICET